MYYVVYLFIVVCIGRYILLYVHEQCMYYITDFFVLCFFFCSLTPLYLVITPTQPFTPMGEMVEICFRDKFALANCINILYVFLSAIKSILKSNH